MQKREDARHALEEEEEEDGEHKDNAEDDGKNVADSLKDSKSKKDDNFFAINNSEVRDSKGNLASMKEGGSKDQESGSKFEGGAKESSKFGLQKKPTAGMGNIMSGLTKSIKAKARVMKIESIYNVTSEKNESFKLSNDSACMGYAVFLKKEFLGMDLQYKQRSDVFMNSMIVHLI